MSFVVVAMVQARLGSSRLPKKVLRDLLGKPMLEQIISQVRASAIVSSVMLSTSDSPQDDELIAFAKSQSMLSGRGPANDIIGRLHSAISNSGADILVRVWGDCPFICPDVIDKMLQIVKGRKLDFLTNSDARDQGVPDGLDVEVYSKRAIRALNESVTDIKLREFPVEAMRDIRELKKEIFKLEGAPVGLHLSVDYPEDLVAANEIYKRLNLPFGSSELFDLLASDMSLVSNFSSAARNIEYYNYLRSKG